MLNDSTPIIKDVPGKHLDPSLLAKSQAHNSLGFIMISYEQKPETSDAPIERYYDLLFLRGSEIYDSARINRDLRFQIHAEAVIQTFRRLRQAEQTRISLYTASDQVLGWFRSTLLYEPCLKVQIAGLSKKQRSALLRTTACHKGIIECNEFIDPTPSIDLREINSPDDIVHFQPPFKRGRILVYDVERNKELIEARHSLQSKQSRVSTTGASDAPAGRALDESRTLIQFTNTSDAPVNDEVLSPVDEQEAEAFTSFIKQILNSPSSAETQSCPCPPLQRRDSEPKRRESKLTRRLTRPHSEKPTSDAQPKSQQLESSEYIKLMERLFRSFRQQVLDSFGDKCDAIIAGAERKVRLLTPDFDLHSLNESDAVLTLDLIETIAADAPFLKRSRLRQAALTLVADLYNKQYELLEEHRVIDKVEQCYYRLKK